MKLAMSFGVLSEDEAIFIAVITSFLSICWYELGVLLHKTFNFPEDQVEHVVSMVHSLIILMATEESLRRTKPFFSHKNQTTLGEELILYLSLGYFLFDTWNWQYRGAISKVILSHHICTLFAMIQALADKTSGVGCMMCLLILEGSNPMLHMRRLLMIMGHIRSGFLYQFTECFFFLFFFIFRFVLGIRFFNFLISSKAPHFMRMTGTLMLMISIIFFKKMLEHLHSKIKFLLKSLKFGPLNLEND